MVFVVTLGERVDCIGLPVLHPSALVHFQVFDFALGVDRQLAEATTLIREHVKQTLGNTIKVAFGRWFLRVERFPILLDVKVHE